MKEQSVVTELRRKIFAEVSRVAYESEAENIADDIEAIPYKITPTEKPQYRESIYRERAIASERVRLAMGMSLRPQDRPVHITSGLSASNIAEQYYEPPLMQVIPSACEKCAVNDYKVSGECVRCMARSCETVCPVDAVFIGDGGRAEINKYRCIRCGRCKAACPYEAIIHKVRPCAKACGVDAVESDTLGRASINPRKCVACGQCMVNCPFGAIADKSQIFQLIRALKRGDKIVAEVAPAIIGQFGQASLGQMRSALKKLGFSEVFEVAVGADISAMEDAEKYASDIATGREPFLLTSCCPSWRMLAKRQFPELRERVSGTLTPMTLAAKSIKEKMPHARVVFIGPCAAKKLEAMRSSVRGEVDFVITFEELAGIFETRGIDPTACEEADTTEGATAAGRGYAVAGGVASAVESCLKAIHPEIQMKMERVESLSECKKMLILAAHGKKNGYLIEGMACPGGCVAGAGVNLPVNKGRAAVNDYVKNTKRKIP